jgi:tight adherence protein C
MNIIIPLLVFIMISAILLYGNSVFEEKRISDRMKKMVAGQKSRGAKLFSGFATRVISPLAFSAYSRISAVPAVKKYRAWAETQIELAGRPAGMDFGALLGAQALSVLIFALFIYAAFDIFSPGALIISAAAGTVLPALWIKSKVTARHRAIFRGLPDVIDTLILSMEAGLDFSSALKKYLEKSRPSAINSEFHIVQQEIGMGKTRIEALNSMSARVRHPAVNSFVISMVQGIQLGTGLVQILKAQSEQLRTQRFQAAEKLAAEMSTKMLFPLLFFIFPTVFIVLFGPIILAFLSH